MAKYADKQAILGDVEIEELNDYDGTVGDLLDKLSALVHTVGPDTPIRFSAGYENVFVLVKILRPETDQEYLNRKRQEHAAKKVEERELAEYARLRAKYGNT